MDHVMADGELRLVYPDVQYETEYLLVQKEWEASGEEPAPWSLGLKSDGFEALVQLLNGYREGNDLPLGFVPFTVLWLVNQSGALLGFIEIRHQLTEFLSFRGGHIGYGTRPSERRKGYARRMLAMALGYCRSLGLGSVLITCSKSNEGSRRTILANGGVLDSEDIEVSGEVFQRYWITLS